MKLYKYTAIFSPEPDEDDVYNVAFPSLPEITTFGESKQEARFMAQDALELVVSSRLEHDETLPANKKPKKLPKGSFSEDVLVSVSHQISTTIIDNHVKAALA